MEKNGESNQGKNQAGKGGGVVGEKRLSEITQPIIIYREDDKEYLSHISVRKEVLKKMPQLRELEDLFWKGKRTISDKIIIFADDYNGALQGAEAIVNYREVDDLDEEIPDEDDYDEWEIGEIEGVTDTINDYEILSAESLIQKEQLTGGLVISNAANNIKKAFSIKAKRVLIKCNSGWDNSLAESLMAFNHMEVVLWFPTTAVNDPLIKKLLFEQNYECVNILKLSMKDYLGYFRDYLKLREISLGKDVLVQDLLNQLVRFRGSEFNEFDIYKYIDDAMERAKEVHRKTLYNKDFRLPELVHQEPALRRLEKMIGMEKIVEEIEKTIAVRVVGEKAQKDISETKMRHTNMAFSGSPGTGKSAVAQIYSQILAEEFITNGKYVKVSRSDLIGKFLGWTAHQIKNAFDSADGGVLFVDEAGCLTGNDDFSKEAITEFVRYMEERPQTTVIFATYPHELKKLLEKDVGLTSRISKFITFPDYTNEDLIKIGKKMLKDEGYKVSDAYDEIIETYISKKRNELGEKFGNAREMRKLVESLIEHYCYRCYKDEVIRKVIGKEDVVNAVDTLLSTSIQTRTMRQIGFVLEKGGSHGNS